MVKQLKVLRPPSLHKLRISHELAGCFDASSAREALVASPFGKVWRVEVGRDGDGTFLGHGWAEFLAAHGIGVGWFVVLRHEGGGVLTIKAFDTGFYIKEFAAPAAGLTLGSSKGVYCKPQFLRIIQQDFMEKMIIPARFVKNYVTEECLSLSAPLASDVLLLRYEGNMVFKFKVFGLNGCQKLLKNHNTGIQQNCVKQESPFRIKKRKVDNERESSEKEKRPKRSMTSVNKASSQNGPGYQIGPPSWIKKEVTAYMLEHLLSLPVKFCHSIGFQRACTIRLKTAMDSTRSWQVRGLVYKKVCYLLGKGWTYFCKENRLKKGDLCTFNVIETTLWHVVISR
ncbi:putative B3 domain-containing protein, partial [Dichanthelium oligosanthes]